MDELYTVLYQGVNLYDYPMTTVEKAAAEDLRQELIEICDSLEVPRGRLADGREYMGRLQDNCDFSMKYSERFGYFVLNGERGRFELMEGFPKKERERAKYILLGHEFQAGGFQYELRRRDSLQKAWEGKYRAEYDSRKEAFEYAIRMMKVVFGCFPEEIIRENTDYMNRWFDEKHWYYDQEAMSFEEH